MPRPPLKEPMDRSLRLTRTFSTFAASLMACLMAGSAMAHHPMGGLPMKTFGDGVLSGLAHPVLGFDHLAFVIAVGLCALRCGVPARAPGAYIAAMLTGCAMMPMGMSLPGKEAWVALSLLCLGALVLAKPRVSPKVSIAMFTFFGLFHGSALGDGLSGAEFGAGTAVIAGYLLGLGFIQYVIARLAALVIQRVYAGTDAPEIPVRLAGAMVAGIGLFLTAESLEGAALSLLGWG